MLLQLLTNSNPVKALAVGQLVEELFFYCFPICRQIVENRIRETLKLSTCKETFYYKIYSVMKVKIFKVHLPTSYL